MNDDGEDEEYNDDDRNVKESINSGGKKLKNSAERLKNLPDTAKKAGKIASKVGNKIESNSKKKALKKLGGKIAKTGGKLTKIGAKTAKIAATLGPILVWVGIILLIIFLIIGLISFILSGPSLIWAEFNKLITKIGNALYTKTTADQLEVEVEDLNNVANYLNQLGYDLYGYGFITKPTEYIFDVENSDNIEEYENETEEAFPSGSTSKMSLKDNYEKNGTYVKVKNKNIYADLKYLLKYLISDNYSYIIKNQNTSIGSWLKSRANEEKGTGLLRFVEDDTFPYVQIARTKIPKNDVYVEDSQLVIKETNELISPSESLLKLKLDGWTGRYSIPLEFLLSVHLATMAPDLAYKLADTYETLVNIKLNKQEITPTIYINTNGNKETGLQFDDVSSPSSCTEAHDIMCSKGISGLESGGEYGCLGIKDEEVYNNSISFAPITETWENIAKNKAKNGVKNAIGNVFEFYGLSDVKNEILNELTFNYYDTSTDTQSCKYKGEFDIELHEEINDRVVHNVEVEIEYTITVVKTSDGKYKANVDSSKLKITEKIDGEYVGDGTLCSSSTCCCCENCIKYIALLVDTYKDAKAKKIKVYSPYISSVTDHWYRNVYFEENVIPGDEKIISVDELYEDETGERWTKYEMYTDSNGNEQYEIHVYLKDSAGNYNTEFTPNLVCREAEDGKYRLAEEGGNKYIKATVPLGETQDKDSIALNKRYNLYIKNGDSISIYSDEPDEFKTGKQAEYTDISYYWDERKVDDDTLWAYRKNTSSSGGKVSNYDIDDLEDLESTGATMNYQYEYTTVDQVEEGVRGSTNSEIKSIFLDEYYKYDGKLETAALISKAREIYGDDPDNWDGSGEVTTYIDSEGNIYDTEESGTTKYSAQKKDISGSINILKNSLSAFTILKNLHTIDAEYIYHDFKELIVELEYFDKEDLYEEPNSVMEFPIQSISSYGWPVNAYEKDENIYGTLIHSEGCLNTLKQSLITEMASRGTVPEDPEGAGDETLPEEGTVEEPTEEPEEIALDYSKNVKEIAKLAATSSTSVSSTKLNETEFEEEFDGIMAQGYHTGWVSINGITYDEWWQTDKTCTLYSFAFMASAYTGESFETYVTGSSGKISAGGVGGSNEFWTARSRCSIY